MKIMLRRKKILITLLIFISISLTIIFTSPYLLARISSGIYVSTHYPNKNFRFESSEYAYGFGDYSVIYKDSSNNSINIMLYPKKFPILIRYDSLKGDEL